MERKHGYTRIRNIQIPTTNIQITTKLKERTRLPRMNTNEHESCRISFPRNSCSFVFIRGFILLSFAVPMWLNSAAGGGSPGLTFEKDIRPILKEHCFDCHGEGDKLRGGLDLRLRRLMLKGGDDGPVIVPGRPEKSLLFKMVHEGEMPKRGKKLTPQEVGLIRGWIADGAKTARAEPVQIEKTAGITDEERAFWSFQPIRQPPLPR